MQPATDFAASDVLPARLPKGTEVDGCVVDGWLRDGGMAAIYRAHRASDAARMALKLQLPSTTHITEICERFDREAEAMRRVSGAPHVVELHRAGVLDDGRRYFVMEWVEGDNLEELLDSLRNDDKRLSVEEACEVGLDIARGLAALHEHGLVHRDLKPSNVMVRRSEGGAPVVKLVDFGIVADLRVEPSRSGSEADHGIEAEAVMGTSAYMAPEQVAGHPPTPAMDVFALGVVLYEALTGSCVPPDGWTPEALPTIESLRRNVPVELVALVRACMSSEVESRPRSGAEVANQLDAIFKQMQASRTRRASSDDMPIRTGGTEITPRSQIAALEDPVVQPGGTEVSLTHEQVLLMSGVISAPPLPATTPRRAPVSDVETKREGGEPPARRWWLVIVALVPVLVGVVWMASSGAHHDEDVAASSSSTMVPSLESTKSVSAGQGSPERTPTPPPPAVVPEPAEPAPHPKLGPAGGTVDSEPDPPPEQESDVEPSQSKPLGAIPKSRPKAPDKAACEAMRANATAAKMRRDWSGVLTATGRAACWSGAVQKLERRRLRVEAYAETGNFAFCVKEGGRSSDAQIGARVKWCNKRLGS